MHSKLEKEHFKTVFETMCCRLLQHREKLLQAVIDDCILPGCCIISCGRQFSCTFWYHHSVALMLIYNVGLHNNPRRDPGEVPVPDQSGPTITLGDRPETENLRPVFNDLREFSDL